MFSKKKYIGNVAAKLGGYGDISDSSDGDEEKKKAQNAMVDNNQD